MRRALIIFFFAFLVAGGAALGYWLGLQRASEAYGKHFVSEAFTRELREAQNDFGLLEALSQNKTDVALQVAQYRYYGRLLLAHEIVQQSGNEISKRLFKEQLTEAKKFQQKQPYQFPAESDQKKWETLIKTLP